MLRIGYLRWDVCNIKHTFYRFGIKNIFVFFRKLVEFIRVSICQNGNIVFFLKKQYEVFCKFRYSIIDKKFYSDEQVYNRVNELFYSVPYNRDTHFDDFDISSKPEIEPILENQSYSYTNEKLYPVFPRKYA